MENNIDFSTIKELVKSDFACQKAIAEELAMAFGKREGTKYVLPAQRERQAAAWLAEVAFESPIYGAFLAVAFESGGLYRHCGFLTSSNLLFRKEKDAKAAIAKEGARESALLSRQFTVTIAEAEAEAAEVTEAAEV